MSLRGAEGGINKPTICEPFLFIFNRFESIIEAEKSPSHQLRSLASQPIRGPSFFSS